MNNLRDLPSVDQLMQISQVQSWIDDYGRTLTLEAIRNVLDEIRKNFRRDPRIPPVEEIINRASKLLEAWSEPTLKPVINAAGVILHTNLGRAPLSQDAMRAAQEVALGYSTLEFDLKKGKRGSRLVHAEALLQHITGAEAALVVNNNASAVLLTLTGLARRRAVVIARSQLVEIGGGFRVPDVMKQSGARLVEIGTTNRIHLADYEQALIEKPALFMRAHRSNFQITGFTSEPDMKDIVDVAHGASIPLVDDLGSGSLLDTTRFGLGHEPTIQESLEAGVDLVCFSGDKLLGGPQAGIIIGRADLVAKLKKHPLARAIRADKLCLSALSATLLHYLKDEAEQKVPIWRMIAASVEDIQTRAQAWRDALGQGNVIAGESTVGGGSLPGETLPTVLLALSIKRPNRLLAQLRENTPPIIARLDKDRVVLDPRTVLPEQEKTLIDGLKEALI